MENKNRLKDGGRIDRSSVLKFSFNGQNYEGFKGDTLASALIANDVMVTARSFKYHRPRGVIGIGVEEPASLVELMGEDASGNNLSTTVLLKRGLKAKSINCWPSVDFDLGAITQIFSKFIPAGFYYKTFKWPNWHLFEPSIRKAAGLASAPKNEPKIGHFESRNAHCDILIIGSGPSGLLAALIAGRAGANVFLIDQNSEAGGSLLNLSLEINNKPAMSWVSEVVNEISKMPNVLHLQNSTAWAYREHNLVIVNQRELNDSSIIERSWRVRTGKTIIATGAMERALVFANNDRPGVMLASAVQGYLNRYAVKPGNNVVIFTNNDSAYTCIKDFQNAGIEIAAIVDSRFKIPVQAIRNAKDFKVFSGSIIKNVTGYKKVTSVVIESIVDKKSQIISCDLVAHSGGWNPTIHLHSQSRGTVRFDEKIAAFVPDKDIQNASCVGACNGKFALNELFEETKVVIHKALIDINLRVRFDDSLVCEEENYTIKPLWNTNLSKEKNKAFFDIQNDVTYDDVQLALREGYSNVEHVKRYTTGGMGFDQGKTGNINIIGTYSDARGCWFGRSGHNYL